MILIVAATEVEMLSFHSACATEHEVETLVTGVGLVEASLALTRHLSDQRGRYDAVINMGVGGAYIGSGTESLDICLAIKEVMGDLGICHKESIELFDSEKLPVINSVSMDETLLQQVCTLLDEYGERYFLGTFVTVNCVTATAERGEILRQTYAAICENMEGAAVARVCQEFAVPCLEIRCISNIVEDRNSDNWCLQEACQRVGVVTARIVSSLLK